MNLGPGELFHGETRYLLLMVVAFVRATRILEDGGLREAETFWATGFAILIELGISIQALP